MIRGSDRLNLRQNRLAAPIVVQQRQVQGLPHGVAQQHGSRRAINRDRLDPPSHGLPQLRQGLIELRPPIDRRFRAGWGGGDPCFGHHPACSIDRDRAGSRCSKVNAQGQGIRHATLPIVSASPLDHPHRLGMINNINPRTLQSKVDRRTP